MTYSGDIFTWELVRCVRNQQTRLLIGGGASAVIQRVDTLGGGAGTRFHYKPREPQAMCGPREGDTWQDGGVQTATEPNTNGYIAARYPLVKLGSSVHKYQRSWHVRNMEFEHVALLGATGHHELLRATRVPVKYRRI